MLEPFPLPMQTFRSFALKVFHLSLLFAIIGNLVAEFKKKLQWLFLIG
jgi:hypothetical protein